LAGELTGSRYAYIPSYGPPRRRAWRSRPSFVLVLFYRSGLVTDGMMMELDNDPCGQFVEKYHTVVSSTGLEAWGAHSSPLGWTTLSCSSALQTTVRLVIGWPNNRFIAYSLAGRHYSVSSVRGCALLRCHLVRGWLTKRLIASRTLPADVGRALKQASADKGSGNKRNACFRLILALKSCSRPCEPHCHCWEGLCALEVCVLIWDFLRHTLPINRLIGLTD
jgi:hypothetical protein